MPQVGKIATMNTDWATHVAWMTASAIMQMGWPGGQAEDGDYDYAEGFREYTEDGDYAEQEGFHEINVFEELMRVATEGLTLLKTLGDGLRQQLWSCEDIFGRVQVAMANPPRPGGDDLNRRAARALLTVDSIVRIESARPAPPGLPEPVVVRDLKHLQRHSQDAILLACCRFVDQRDLQRKGIHGELLLCLEDAFPQGALLDDDLWSRLGNSKYHVFTPGVVWQRFRS